MTDQGVVVVYNGRLFKTSLVDYTFMLVQNAYSLHVYQYWNLYLPQISI